MLFQFRSRHPGIQFITRYCLPLVSLVSLQPTAFAANSQAVSTALLNPQPLYSPPGEAISTSPDFSGLPINLEMQVATQPEVFTQQAVDANWLSSSGGLELDTGSAFGDLPSPLEQLTDLQPSDVEVDSYSADAQHPLNSTNPIESSEWHEGDRSSVASTLQPSDLPSPLPQQQQQAPQAIPSETGTAVEAGSTGEHLQSLQSNPATVSDRSPIPMQLLKDDRVHRMSASSRLENSQLSEPSAHTQSPATIPLLARTVAAQFPSQSGATASIQSAQPDVESVASVSTATLTAVSSAQVSIQPTHSSNSDLLPVAFPSATATAAIPVPFTPNAHAGAAFFYATAPNPAHDVSIPQGYVRLSNGVYVSQASLQSTTQSGGSDHSPQTAEAIANKNLAPASIASTLEAAAADHPIEVAYQTSPDEAPYYQQSIEQSVQQSAIEQVYQRALDSNRSDLEHNIDRFLPSPFSQVGFNLNSPLFPLSVAVSSSSPYGWRGNRMHDGVDFPTAIGTPVLASWDGVVESTGWLDGYGLTVIVRHETTAGSYSTLYAHLSQSLVTTGQPVHRGEVLAHSGNSGRTTGPHLHFEIQAWNGSSWNAININAIMQQSLARFETDRAPATAPSTPAAVSSTGTTATGTEIRVALEINKASIQVGTSTPAQILTTDGQVIGTFNSSATATPNGSGIQLANMQLPAVFFIQPSGDGLVAVGNSWYRGKLLVGRSGADLIAVNWVDIESYLSSVVGGEAYPSWDADALEAQAVAARSYAVSHIFNPADPNWYDLDDTPRFQIYHGISSEYSTSVAAVQRTAGQVLMRGGEVLEALYASTQELVDEAHGGVGMSQYGASDLANQGYSYLAILTHYYPNSQLGQLN